MRNKKGQFVKGSKPVNGFKKGVATWKGKKHTEESKKKMSLAKKGKPTWNKGTAKFDAKAYNKEWRKTHKEWLSNYVRKWKQNNPDKKRALYEYKQQWRKTHPQNEQTTQQRRKANLYKAKINDLTPKQWIELVIKYNSCCAYCGKLLPLNQLTQDHIIPLSRGGNHTKSNIVPACISCNCRKNDLLFSEDIKSNFQLFKVYLTKEI